MIDYDKLRLAHKIAQNLANQTGSRVDIGISFYADDVYPCNLYHFIDSTNDDLHEYENIEDLILDLSELIKPEPKYEVGQKVYRYGSKGGMVRATITRIEHGQYYLAGFGDLTHTEDDLYPTRESLINAQIEYWTSLREPVNPEEMKPEFEGEIKGFSGIGAMADFDSVSYKENQYAVRKARLRKKCPFTDFKGNEIWEFDVLAHPVSNETFRVTYDESKENPWRALYENGESLHLGAQISERGMAIKVECEHIPDDTPYLSDPFQYKCVKCGEFYR